MLLFIATLTVKLVLMVNQTPQATSETTKVFFNPSIISSNYWDLTRFKTSLHTKQ